MPTHYVFPSTGLALTVIPKTGCTTLLNYVLNLEQLSKVGSEGSFSDAYENMAIHGSKELFRYQVKSRDSDAFRSSYRLLVLRNPYKRALSAWTNKLLYAQDDATIFYDRAREEFTPVRFTSLSEVNHYFSAFLDRLDKDPAFLASDRHWRPQSTFVSEVSDYDLVLETDFLSTLQESLEKFPKLRGIVHNRPVPRFNETRPALDGMIGNSSDWSLIEEIYSSDFRLLNSADLPSSNPPRKSRLSLPRQEEALTKERAEIFASRTYSLIAFLDILKSSRTWRWTAWARKLFAPFVRGR